MKGIIDSTLREGEQSAHVYFDLMEKLRIIDFLIKVGIDEIEIGVAVGNPEIKELLNAAKGLDGCPRLALWCRCLFDDIKETLALSPDILALSVPVSDIHMEHKLGRNRAWVLARVRDAIRLAKDENPCCLSLGLEDASRAEPGFVEEISSLAAEEGASRIRFADTVGIMDPVSMFEAVRSLKNRVNIDVGVHTHNDFGMATANAVSALKAGADFVDVTVSGIGERAGNAALEEVVAFLAKRYDMRQYHLKHLPELTQYVARAIHIPLSPKRPVVGRDIFTCESGIHIDGLIKNTRNYEPFDPAEVSLKRKIVIGKKSGRNALCHKLNTLGVALEENLLTNLLAKVKEESSRSKMSFTDHQLLHFCELEKKTDPKPNCH